MSIDKTGQWWVGNQPDDICEFLTSYASQGYEIDDFVAARCICSSLSFNLDADDDEGVAKRTCVACGLEHFICDSSEYWSDADPTRLVCVECRSETTNVGVGFSIYPNREGIRWLYVGTRCVQCGTLGCFAGWKIGTYDSMSLLEQV